MPLELKILLTAMSVYFLTALLTGVWPAHAEPSEPSSRFAKASAAEMIILYRERYTLKTQALTTNLHGN